MEKKTDIQVEKPGLKDILNNLVRVCKEYDDTELALSIYVKSLCEKAVNDSNLTFNVFLYCDDKCLSHKMLEVHIQIEFSDFPGFTCVPMEYLQRIIEVMNGVLPKVMSRSSCLILCFPFYELLSNTGGDMSLWDV